MDNANKAEKIAAAKKKVSSFDLVSYLNQVEINFT